MDFGRVLRCFGSHCSLSQLLAVGGLRGECIELLPSLAARQSFTRVPAMGKQIHQPKKSCLPRKGICLLHPKLASPGRAAGWGCPPCSLSLGQQLSATNQRHIPLVPTCLGDATGTRHPPGTASGAGTPRATCVGNKWVALHKSGCLALARAQKDQDSVGYQQEVYIGAKGMGKGRRVAGAQRGPGRILAQSAEQSAQHSLSTEGCCLLRRHVWRDQLSGAYSQHQPHCFSPP